MWDLARSSEWDVTVRSVERRRDPLPSPDAAPVRPAGQFVLFVVDLTNRTSRLVSPRPGDFVLRPAEELRSVNLGDTPIARTYAGGVGLTPFGDVVPPGATVTTLVLFAIDPRAGRLTLRFLPASQPIRIDECKCNLPSPVRSVSAG
jgi:hypothetical protein